MNIVATPVHAIVWVAIAAAHAGLAAWAIWAGVARDLDDKVQIGVQAHPAAAHWFTLPLVWVVLGNEALAAVFALATAATGRLAIHGFYVFFWVDYALVSAVLIAVFLAWTGVIGVASLVSLPVVSAFAPAALLAAAEIIWALAARFTPAYWARSRAAHGAWVVLGLAALLVALALGVFVERALAATLVRGDRAVFVATISSLLGAATAWPVVASAWHHLRDGYFTATGNVQFGDVRAIITVGLRIAATAVLLAAFQVGARDLSASN